MKATDFCAAFAAWLSIAAAAHGDEWLGRRVMLKENAQPRVGTRSVDRSFISSPSTVEQVDGEWLWLGRAWVRRSEVRTIDQAIAYYSQKLAANPRDDAAYHNRGNAWSEKQEYDNAIADYTEAIRLDPAYADSYNSRANAWQMKGESEIALRDYSEALRLDPKNVRVYVNRADCSMTMKNPDAAIRDCTEAIRLDPGYSNAYLMRGKAKKTKNDCLGAQKDFEASLRCDGRNLVAMRALAWLKATCPDQSIRDGARAVKLATEACEATGWRDAAIIIVLAAAHAEQGEYDKAVEMVGKARALEQDPELRVAWSALGVVFAGKTPYRDNSTDESTAGSP